LLGTFVRCCYVVVVDLVTPLRCVYTLCYRCFAFYVTFVDGFRFVVDLRCYVYVLIAVHVTLRLFVYIAHLRVVTLLLVVVCYVTFVVVVLRYHVYGCRYVIRYVVGCCFVGWLLFCCYGLRCCCFCSVVVVVTVMRCVLLRVGYVAVGWLLLFICYVRVVVVVDCCCYAVVVDGC